MGGCGVWGGGWGDLGGDLRRLTETDGDRRKLT